MSNQIVFGRGKILHFRNSQSRGPRRILIGSNNPSHVCVLNIVIYYKAEFLLKLPLLLFIMTRYPKSGLDERIPEFLERLFRATDDPQLTEEYVSLFTADASFKCGPLVLHGTEGDDSLLMANGIGLRQLRGMMWDVRTKHTVEDVYIRDPMGLDIMVSGTSTFFLKSESVTLDIAAKINLVSDDIGLKIKSLTTYVVHHSHLCQLSVRITHLFSKQWLKKRVRRD